MSDTVQQIKDRLSIVDVVSGYTELASAGKNLKGKSPFTNEKTPSFFVSPDRGMYYCFSTNQGGDIFSFIQAMEGVDFKGALSMLAERANVELVKVDPKARDERDQSFAAVDKAAAFYESRLKDDPEAIAYLTDRGVTKQSIATWRLGYAPNAWRDAKEHLAKSGFPISLIQKVALIKGDPGKEPYDVFRDRVMFPISDASGRVVGFSGRILHPDDKAPKYVNSPESPLFNKSEIMFGYDKAKQGIRKLDFSLIVEGQFDLVLAHQAGYTNTVAVSGTALTPHHVQLLQRLSNRVVLALDADRAGIEAIKKASHLMLGRGMDVKVIRMPDGKDPADIIAEDPAQFKKLVGSGVHVVEFLLAVLKDQTNDERAYKLRAREEVLPYLLQIPDHIDREHFEIVVAEALQTTKDAIHYEVERLSEQTDNAASSAYSEAATTAATPVGRLKDVEEYLVVLATVSKDSEPHAKIASVLHQLLEPIITDSVAAVYTGIEATKQQKLLFDIEAMLETISEHALIDDVVTKLTELHTNQLRSQMASLKTTMKEAETAGDQEKISSLLQEITELQRSLSLVAYDPEQFVK